MIKLEIKLKNKKGKTKIDFLKKQYFTKKQEEILSSLLESKINNYLKELNLKNE